MTPRPRRMRWSPGAAEVLEVRTLLSAMLVEGVGTEDSLLTPESTLTLERLPGEGGKDNLWGYVADQQGSAKTEAAVLGEFAGVLLTRQLSTSVSADDASTRVTISGRGRGGVQISLSVSNEEVSAHGGLVLHFDGSFSLLIKFGTEARPTYTVSSTEGTVVGNGEITYSGQTERFEYNFDSPVLPVTPLPVTETEESIDPSDTPLPVLTEEATVVITDSPQASVAAVEEVTTETGDEVNLVLPQVSSPPIEVGMLTDGVAFVAQGQELTLSPPQNEEEDGEQKAPSDESDLFSDTQLLAALLLPLTESLTLDIAPSL